MSARAAYCMLLLRPSIDVASGIVSGQAHEIHFPPCLSFTLLSLTSFSLPPHLRPPPLTAVYLFLTSAHLLLTSAHLRSSVRRNGFVVQIRKEMSRLVVDGALAEELSRALNSSPPLRKPKVKFAETLVQCASIADLTTQSSRCSTCGRCVREEETKGVKESWTHGNLL